MGGWKNLPQHHPCSGYSGTPGALGSREDYGWPHSAWSAFVEAIRTNNVVEGWHRRLNERASHGQLNIYQVVSIMHTAQRGRVCQPAGVPGFEAEVEKTPTTNVRTVPGTPLQPVELLAACVKVHGSYVVAVSPTTHQLLYVSYAAAMSLDTLTARVSHCNRLHTGKGVGVS